MAREHAVESPQERGNTSKHKGTVKAHPQQFVTRKLENPTADTKVFNPHELIREPLDFDDLEQWLIAKIDIQLKRNIVNFPVRVHLVGTDDELHEIIGVHRDIPFEELQQLIYESLEIKGWVSLDMDARWMSEADWKFVCDSAPVTVFGPDSNGDSSSQSQPAWEGNRHTPITPLNCANVLDLLRIRKGKDFISVKVTLKVESTGRGDFSY